MYNTIEKINPSPSKRQQKILLYNIIEVINIHPYYTQKTEDDIAKYHSEDEFKYRKISSLLRWRLKTVPYFLMNSIGHLWNKLKVLLWKKIYLKTGIQEKNCKVF